MSANFKVLVKFLGENPDRMDNEVGPGRAGGGGCGGGGGHCRLGRVSFASHKLQRTRPAGSQKFFTLIDQFQTTFCRTIEAVRKEKDRKERMLKKEAEKKLRDAARSARAINRTRTSTRRDQPK